MAEHTWRVRLNGKDHGPFSGNQLKQLADESKLTPEMLVSNDGHSWVKAATVQGLFKQPSQPALPPAAFPTPRQTTVLKAAPPVPGRALAAPPEKVLAVAPARTAPVAGAHAVPTAATAPPVAPPAARVPCPFCGEEILPAAVKCRHCNEFLDPRLRVQTQQPTPQQAVVYAQAPAPSVNVVVNQHTHLVNNVAAPRWSRGVAMLLSFLIPGAGQIYKGQLINGIAWFVIVAIGYVFLVFPGLLLHFCCVIGAGMGDPYR